MHCIRSKLCLNRDSIFSFIFLVCVKVQTDVHAHGRLEETTKSSSDTFYFIPLRRVLSLNPELSNLARLAGQKSPRILPSSGFISTDSHVHFYVGIEIRTQIPRLVHQGLPQPLKEC